MLLHLLLQAAVSIISVALFFLPPVTALPFGVDDALTWFGGTIKALIEQLPIMETPWKLALFGLFVEFLLQSWHWIKWLIERIR